MPPRPEQPGYSAPDEPEELACRADYQPIRGMTSAVEFPVGTTAQTTDANGHEPFLGLQVSHIVQPDDPKRLFYDEGGVIGAGNRGIRELFRWRLLHRPRVMTRSRNW
jgi:hypothetical protein